MGLFKPDFYRFFVFGFAAGAALVVATMDGNTRAGLTNGIVPAAQAAPTQISGAQISGAQTAAAQ